MLFPKFWDFSCYNNYMIASEIIFLVLMFIFGAILGSFACCQAWRIYLKETKKQGPGKWSVCLNCGKRLKPAENIPIFSWLYQRGKCKKCGAKIGKAEILSEISLAVAYVAVGAFFWPELVSMSTGIEYKVFLLTLMILLLVILVPMWILLVHDAKWGLLPTKMLMLVNILAGVYLVIRVVAVALGGNFWPDLLEVGKSLVAGIALLPGIYYILYRISNERLVGSGDWLVALAISLVLGDWWLCLLTLFLSNLMGSIVGLPMKLKKKQKTIPFGPFLILAFVMIYCVQGWLLALFPN